MCGALALVVGLALPTVPSVAVASAPRYGSHILFHGWSPSSQYIAYTRTRRRPPARRGQRPPAPETQRMHRQVLLGAFAGFGTKVGGDVAEWARTHGYVDTPALRSRPSPRRTVFAGPGADELVFDVTVGERVGWTLRAGDELLAEHAFDTLYVEVDAQLHLAPDGSQAVLVLHLNTGWVIDSAIHPVALQRP